jgi:hypothetical protein
MLAHLTTRPSPSPPKKIKIKNISVENSSVDMPDREAQLFAFVGKNKTQKHYFHFMQKSTKLWKSQCTITK